MHAVGSAQRRPSCLPHCYGIPSLLPLRGPCAAASAALAALQPPEGCSDDEMRQARLPVCALTILACAADAGRRLQERADVHALDRAHVGRWPGLLHADQGAEGIRCSPGPLCCTAHHHVRQTLPPAPHQQVRLQFAVSACCVRNCQPPLNEPVGFAASVFLSARPFPAVKHCCCHWWDSLTRCDLYKSYKVYHR